MEVEELYERIQNGENFAYDDFDFNTFIGKDDDLLEELEQKYSIEKIKRFLVFDTTDISARIRYYHFDVDPIKKENIGAITYFDYDAYKSNPFPTIMPGNIHAYFAEYKLK